MSSSNALGLLVQESVFAQNVAGGSGGNMALLSVYGRIDESHVLGGEATSTGGGVLVEQGFAGASVVFRRSIIATNRASEGGAGVAVSSAGLVRSVRSAYVFNQGTGSGSVGGGFWVASGSDFIDSESMYAHNFAGRGGGLAISGGATVGAQGSVWYDNSATSGGGLSCDGDSDIDIVGMAARHSVQHTTGVASFLDNTAEVLGGGAAFEACRSAQTNVSYVQNSMRLSSRFRTLL